MSILDVTNTFDFTANTTLSNVTQINLTGYYFSFGPLGGGWVPARPVFAASQFDNVHISSTVQFVNTNGLSHEVTVNGSLLDASGWSFTGWLPANVVRLNGTAGDDNLKGSSQNDVFTAGKGIDTLDGGGGLDTIDYSSCDGSVRVDLARHTAGGSDAEGDSLTSFENVTGGAFADSLLGDGSVNILRGGGGNDFLQGRGGGDTLEGADGIDTLSYEGSLRAVIVNLATNSAAGGDAEGDIISGFENLRGGFGNDRLTGTDGNNALRGNAGADFISAAAGADSVLGGDGGDTILGGAGSDTLLGEAGDDRLTGGADEDVLTGGRGKDTFIFTDISDSGIGLLRDVITDFTQGEDKISLARIDAIVGTGDDPFTFFGRVPPQGIDGELRYHFVTSQGATRTIVSFDTDGDGAANGQIALLGRIELTAADFIL